MISFDWSSIILFGSVINTIIIFIVLALNRVRYSLKSLIAIILILLCILLIIAERIIRFSGLEELYPELLFVTSPLLFFVLPLIYSFQKSLIRLPKYWYLHFIIPILILILLMPTIIMNELDKLEMYNTEGINDPLLVILFYTGYAIFYIGKIFITNKNHSIYLLNEHANNDVELQLFSNRLVFYSSILMLCIPISFLTQYSQYNSDAFEKILFIVFSISTHIILISLVTKKQLILSVDEDISIEDNHPYKDIDLSKRTSELSNYIDNNKPYVNRDLTLQILANQIGWSRSKLSLVINKGFNKNFYDYINEHRLDLVIDKLKQKEYENYSLDYIVSESGFKSYVSFYRVFKRVKNISPKDYIKELKKT